MMDLASDLADRIEIKLKFSKSGCTAGVNTIKCSVLMKKLKVGRVFGNFKCF